jgi:hypothetical protein
MSNSVAKQKLAALAAGHEPAMPPRNCRHCGITLFRSPNATEDVTNCQLSGNGTLLPSKFAITEAVPRQSCRAGANDGFENFSAEIHQLDIAIDSVKILSAGLGGPEWTGRNRLGPNRAKNEQNMLDKMKVVVHIQGGEHLVQAYFASKTATIPEDLFDPSVRREPYRAIGGIPKLSFLRITGPLKGTASVSTETRAAAACLSAAPHHRPTRRAPGGSSRRSRAAPIVIQ